MKVAQETGGGPRATLSHESERRFRVSLKHQTRGAEVEFEPGSRGRVLRNLLGIIRVREMNEAESQALLMAQDAALDRYGPKHRFTVEDVCELHRLWLGSIYSWAGEFRSVDIGKGGFRFAHAPRIPALMTQLERNGLRRYTPCRAANEGDLAQALAEVHADLMLVHPFRDGNGRLARLLAVLMALQAGFAPLDLTPLAGRDKRGYIAGIRAALDRDYKPLARVFMLVIARSKRRASFNARGRSPRT